MNIFEKIKFLLKKPKVILVTGEGRVYAKEAIFQVLKPYFKVGEEISIFETDLTNEPYGQKVKFLIRNCSLPVLVVTQVGDADFIEHPRQSRDIPLDKDFFAGEKEKVEEIIKLAKILPPYGHLILNFDDETVREIKTQANLKAITFGFGEGADFRASDIKINSGTNFKVNERGNVVPIWLEGLFGKEQIYSALAAAAVGTIFGLNLIEISQALKNYQPFPGKI